MSKLATLRSSFCRFCADESGATAIEYALIAGGVGVTVASSVYALGTHVKTGLYEKIAAIFP